MSSEYINIKVTGKNLPTKHFEIATDKKIDIIKRLILARLKYKNEYIQPDWDNSFLMNESGTVLNNNALIKDLIKAKLIHNNCSVCLDIQVKIPSLNQNISLNSHMTDSVEFTQVNDVKVDKLNNLFGMINIGNAVHSLNVINPLSKKASSNEKSYKSQVSYNFDDDDYGWWSWGPDKKSNN